MECLYDIADLQRTLLLKECVVSEIVNQKKIKSTNELSNLKAWDSVLNILGFFIRELSILLLLIFSRNQFNDETDL